MTLPVIVFGELLNAIQVTETDLLISSGDLELAETRLKSLDQSGVRPNDAGLTKRKPQLHVAVPAAQTNRLSPNLTPSREIVSPH
jgi:hypothetical protein